MEWLSKGLKKRREAKLELGRGCQPQVTTFKALVSSNKMVIGCNFYVTTILPLNIRSVVVELDES